MAYWRRTIRRINGKRRVVKVHSGRYGSGRVRILNRRNYTDRTAPRRLRRRRVKRYWNKPDSHGREYRR